MKYPASLRPGQGKIQTSFPIIAITFCISFLDSQTLDIALPRIQHELDLSRSTVQWLGSITTLLTAATVIPISRICQRLGYVLVFKISTMLIFLLQITFFMTKSIFWLMLSIRLILGVGFAGISASRYVMYKVLPMETNQKSYIQISVVITQVISLITPIISGAIIQYLYYKYSYLVMACLSLIGFFCLLFFQNNSSPIKIQQDILGSFCIILSIGALCLAFTFISIGYYYIAVTIFVLFVVFSLLLIFTEKKVQNPLIPSAISVQPLLQIIIVDFNNNIILSALNYILPQYSALIHEPTTMSSFIFTLIASFSLIISIIIPIIQTKVLNYHIILASTISIVLLSIGIFFTQYDKNTFYILYCCIQVFCQIIYTVVYPLLLLSIPFKHYSNLSAVPTVCRTIGHSLSLNMFSMIQQLTAKYYTGKSAEQFGYLICFLFFVPLSIINGLLAWLKIGASETEKYKIGYKPSMVRVVVEDENENLI
ncbi:Major facilitator superfamily protein [Spironucleus salmonicida]|nr:Major facilitator superfamily protein [Spironucleus salmonicida]